MAGRNWPDIVYTVLIVSLVSSISLFGAVIILMFFFEEAYLIIHQIFRAVTSALALTTVVSFIIRLLLKSKDKKEIMGKLETMDKKLDKLDLIDKKLDKLDLIDKKLDKLDEMSDTLKEILKILHERLPERR